MAQVETNLSESFQNLRKWVELQQFRGWDPYDALLSHFPFKWAGHWGKVAAIQFFKRSPINLRPVFGVPKQANPKGLGIFLEIYSKLKKKGDKEGDAVCMDLLGKLIALQSKGYSGACWGYNFPWSGPSKQLPAYYPSSVVTANVVRGLFELYMAGKDQRVLELIDSVPAFLLSDLPRIETEEGICFSYTPNQKDVCYNASLFAAETLARCDAVHREEKYKETVFKAVDFVISRQKADGSWMYSEGLGGGDSAVAIPRQARESASAGERKQIDFHQGFILDSIFHIKTLYNYSDENWESALRKGAEFYFEKQFTKEGRSLRRLPRKWPADIHAQAQGIITFTLLHKLDARYLGFAEKIAAWTIRHMQSPAGYFYYQKYPVVTIKTAYMRWGQAWMMKALFELLRAKE